MNKKIALLCMLLYATPYAHAGFRDWLETASELVRVEIIGWHDTKEKADKMVKAQGAISQLLSALKAKTGKSS